jgi:DNA-binding CsgD family transcriptional regulator
LLLNQAAALGDLDRCDEAIVAAERACEQADASGNMVRLAQATSVLGELLFDAGRWEDALKRLNLRGENSGDIFVECCDHGVMATIRLHQGDPAAARNLLDAQVYQERLGSDRLVGSLLLADTVRLSIVVGDVHRARTLASRAEALAELSEVFHRKAIGLHCRGLVDNDTAKLIEAAEQYEKAGRPLPRAQALEAAGVGFAKCNDVSAARNAFTEAYEAYSTLGADWDLARLQARFRAHGIRRGPRFQHRRSQQGWSSLTPTEEKVVGLVAKGLSNPQIAAQLFLSRRTVQTHVSHVLAKLELSSRTDIAREASRNGF